MMNASRSACLLFLVLVAGAAHSWQSPTGSPAAPGRGNLHIDFGPAQATHPPLSYSIPWKQGIDVVQYLQIATEMQPPLTYVCHGQDPAKPCYQQHGDCSVVEINGVKNGVYNGRNYGWIWEIDGNQGALPACIYNPPSAKNVISYKLLELHVAK